VFPGLEQPGVNFTNILRAAFSYKSLLRSFYVVTIWVRNFLAKCFWRKSCSLNVGEIDTWQSFTRSEQQKVLLYSSRTGKFDTEWKKQQEKGDDQSSLSVKQAGENLFF
jgi:hypothetical protein